MTRLEGFAECMHVLAELEPEDARAVLHALARVESWCMESLCPPRRRPKPMNTDGTSITQEGGD